MDAKEQTARVRFAPSPTGYLHVGGARTAIFNWLFARRMGGTFILRIEDTDAIRSTRNSENSLLEDLRWLGLDWDEGPGAGGEFAPYRQSERASLYKDRADGMLEMGHAYPCFCTDDILGHKRRAALTEGRSPHYDGTCRSLSQSEIAEKRKTGAAEVVRFRVPDENVLFSDCVRGNIEMPASMVGDFVIMRSNGLPTYNFAAVVDDNLMRVTHVLRGEEHLPNTLRQIFLYRVFSAEPPVFGHLPLILGDDRSKLSKRHGAGSIAELRARGYLASAVINYLALLGWSHPSGREVLSPGELVSEFSLDRINKSAAIFDKKKLRWMNGMHIRALSVEGLLDLSETFFPAGLKDAYDKKARLNIIELLRKKMELLSDVESFAPIFGDKVAPGVEAAETLRQKQSRKILEIFKRKLEALPGAWSAELIKKAIKESGGESGLKGKQLYFPLRAAVTGEVHGPDLAGIIAVKGRNRVLSLLNEFIHQRGEGDAD